MIKHGITCCLVRIDPSAIMEIIGNGSRELQNPSVYHCCHNQNIALLGIPSRQCHNATSIHQQILSVVQGAKYIVKSHGWVDSISPKGQIDGPPALCLS